jgi:hypothetical protein
MMATTAGAGAADTLVVPVGTMTIVGVAAPDIAGITIETTIEGSTGTDRMVAASTVISAATAQAIRDTSGAIPTDMDIGSRYLTAA